MKRHKRMRALLPAMVLLLLLDITLTKGMLGNRDTLNVMFGKGAQRVTNNAGAVDAGYYPTPYKTSAEAKAAALDVSKKISDEGIVLLKNDGALPLSANQTVSPFGVGFFDPYYCGGGSSSISTLEEDVVSPAEGLASAFANINMELLERQERSLRSHADLSSNPSIVTTSPAATADSSEAAILHEFDISVFDDLRNSFAGSAGLVFIKRQTGENQDAYLSAYDDQTPHMLAITSAEQAMVDYAAANCASVIVILCSASPMQIGALEDHEGVNAIVWVGGAGSTGYASLADVLAGKVNPSGRLPATYPADFTKDPTYVNHDDGTDRFVYENAATTLISSVDMRQNVNAAFHEFEEGIYVGYKYYETAYDIGVLDDYDNRNNGVVYPFGYGLSYTEFSQEIVGYTFSDTEITLTVEVRNIGSRYAGKDVIQIYGTAPYTTLDAEYKIEKASVALLRFAKTALLAPGEAGRYTFTIPLEDMASYCYTRDNGDGTTGCYTLSAGQYIFSLRSNSHEVLDSRSYRLPQTHWFERDNPRSSEKAAQTPLDANGKAVPYAAHPAYRAATNQFEQLNQYMTSGDISNAAILSRSNWPHSLPTAPTAVDRNASTAVAAAIQKSDVTAFHYQTDETLGNHEGSYVYASDMPACPPPCP